MVGINAPQIDNRRGCPLKFQKLWAAWTEWITHYKSYNPWYFQVNVPTTGGSSRPYFFDKVPGVKKRINRQITLFWIMFIEIQKNGWT